MHCDREKSQKKKWIMVWFLFTDVYGDWKRVDFLPVLLVPRDLKIEIVAS